jgi:TRAP-type uncharacterized transport system fused permease subunit
MGAAARPHDAARSGMTDMANATQPSEHEGLSQAEIDELVAQADTGGRTAGGFIGRLIAGIALVWSLFQLWFASPLPFHARFRRFQRHRGALDPSGLRVVSRLPAFPPGHARRPRPSSGSACRWSSAVCWRSRRATSSRSGSCSRSPSSWRRPARCRRATTASPSTNGYWRLSAASAPPICSSSTRHRRPCRPADLHRLRRLDRRLLLLLEATRRSLGPALVIVASLFLVYTVLGPYMPEIIAHKGNNLREIINHHWITTEGVFGIALGVSTSFVFLFVLFGALLDKAGAGNYFIQVAFSLMGHMKGGPAKAAVVSSAMTGLISGSSIANVVTTGTFTIPLMKKVGFSSEKAGAVEVASSVNGQIMPPVMGAAAFLMVEYVGIPYFDVVKHAFLPALISYIALVYIVHLEAAKAGMEGLPRAYEPGPSCAARRASSSAFSCSARFPSPSITAWAGSADLRRRGALCHLRASDGGLCRAGRVWLALSRTEDGRSERAGETLPLPGPTIKSGLHFILPVSCSSGR